MSSDPRVDAYIKKAPEFAQPILTEIRSRIVKACPQAQETIKWNVPFFTLEGKLLASMAAFKQHAKAGIWAGESPIFVDVSSVEELPPARDFAQKVRVAVARIRDAAPQAEAKKAGAKKVGAKKAGAKKVGAKKAGAKKAGAKKAP